MSVEAVRNDLSAFGLAERVTEFAAFDVINNRKYN